MTVEWRVQRAKSGVIIQHAYIGDGVKSACRMAWRDDKPVVLKDWESPVPRCRSCEVAVSR